MPTGKVIRRRVIMREYDFNKVVESALTPSLYIVGDSLYDRVEFRPFTRDQLEKDAIVYALKYSNRKNPFQPVESSGRFLLNLRAYLYNNRYVNWRSWYDDEGYICIQSRKNNPVSRLGWGIFEKDT